MKKRHRKMTTYVYKWLKIKADFKITSEKMHEIAYMIEEAFYLERMGTIPDSISEIIELPLEYISIKINSRLFNSYQVKRAILKLGSKKSMK